MAYQTGSATDIVDLMSLLYTFASTNAGFTAVATTGTTFGDYTIYLKKGIYTWQFRARDNFPAVSGNGILSFNEGFEAYILQGDYNAGETYLNQPGRGGTENNVSEKYYPVCNCWNGTILEYHFFYNDNIVSVAAKTSQGQWKHFGFGNILMHYTIPNYGGGAFITTSWTNEYSNTNITGTNSNMSSFIRSYWGMPYSVSDSACCLQIKDDSLDYLTNEGQAGTGYFYKDCLDTGTNDLDNGYPNIYGSAGYAYGTAGWVDCVNATIYNYAPFYAFNEAGLNCILYPIYITRPDDITVDKQYIMGEVPPVRQTNNKYLEDGEIVSFAGSNWKVFPLARKTNLWESGDLMPQSLRHAIAYKYDGPV